MRVLLALGWYFPDPVGGTETHVRGLAVRLSSMGVDVTVAAPQDGGCERRYEHEGVAVRRYPVTPTPGAAELSGLVRPEGFGAWEAILDELAPDLVDVHSLTRGIGLPHLRAAAARGARTVVTVHVPGPVCPRGTLLRFGRVPCDADLARRPCTACRLQGLGVPRPLGAVAAAVSPLARRLAGGLWPGRPRGLLRAADATAEHRVRLRETVARADRVVAVCHWLAEALLRNGVPATKLSVCPQGIEPGAARPPRSVRAGRLSIGYLGRYDRVKGIHVLVDAVRRLPPAVGLDCHIWGSGEGPAARRYRARLAEAAAGDARIRLHGPVSRAAEALAEIDVLVVPSLWLETGPLVVLEAFAAGVPVVGSALGGIAERVRDGVDGVLVPHGDAGALARVLGDLARDPARVARLRRGIGPVRTAGDVARQTHDLYAELLAARAAGPARRQPVA